jgi:WYL_2, Sm-like SH3 beta-barrel fold
MGMYKRDDILKDLKQSVIEVTFTKVNGQKRVLRCSLDPRYVKAPMDMNHLDEEHKKRENKDTIVCWDVHNGGWRSFRVDSVEYVQEIEGY